MTRWPFSGVVRVLSNDQKFPKTANCWGVDNNTTGTNTNRVVLLRSPEKPVVSL